MSAVGRGIGTTYQQVRKYESGENRISASTLYRLANLLSVDIAYFFREETPKAEHGAPAGSPMNPNLKAALGRIEDEELRVHLHGLLRALGIRG